MVCRPWASFTAALLIINSVLLNSPFAGAQDGATGTSQGDGSVEAHAPDLNAAQEAGDVHTATVEAIDGTTIDMVVNSDGQAVAVALDAPGSKRRHKHRHHADEGIDSPADEQLNAGLLNETSPALIEDSMPQVSTDLPH